MRKFIEIEIELGSRKTNYRVLNGREVAEADELPRFFYTEELPPTGKTARLKSDEINTLMRELIEIKLASFARSEAISQEVSH